MKPLLQFLLLMFMLMWQIAAFESAVFSLPLTEETAKAYLSKPYISSPLVEGSPPGVDCTTYVEEVLAEKHENPDIALNLIRYENGNIDFFSRNHFMEEMWIPNALRHGFIAPIVLPDAIDSLIEVDLAEWYRVNPEIVVKDEAYFHKANAQGRFTASIPYVPAARINEAFLKRLPEETVVFFLRHYSRTPYQWLLNNDAVMVTHMGFLFGGHRLYHASSVQKQVVKVGFSMYLRDNPGICGAAFYEITELR